MLLPQFGKNFLPFLAVKFHVGPYFFEQSSAKGLFVLLPPLPRLKFTAFALTSNLDALINTPFLLISMTPPGAASTILSLTITV
ncbi:hypothetical protein D3C71_1561600 [compost metagenome]